MEILNHWVIYIILYLVLETVFTQGFKIATKTLQKAGALIILLQLLAGSTVLLLCPFFEFKFSTNPSIYIMLGIAIIFYTLSDRINTTVRSGIEASTFSMLKQLSTTFMIFAGLIFFKEPFVLTKFIGAMLIIFSNVLIFYQKGKFQWNRYVLLGILGNITFSIALFLDVNLSESFTLPIYVASTLMIPAVLIMIFERVKPSQIKKEFVLGNKKAIVITALSWGVTIVSQLRAYQLQDVSIVAPLCAVSVILNVAVRICFLKGKR